MSELNGTIESTPSTPFITGDLFLKTSKPPTSYSPKSPPISKGWTNLIRPVSEASPTVDLLL